VLLTFKLEHLLSKDQILEIYMNQIFLGNRAYGFAAASEAYFGKPLKELTIAEAAMLAGLPKAPSAYNPVNNPSRARGRQLYIIERMEENGFITAEQAAAAKKEELHVRTADPEPACAPSTWPKPCASWSMRSTATSTYTRGLNVYTSLVAARPGGRVQVAAQGHHGLREAPDLPRPREASSTCPSDPRSSTTPSTTRWPTTPTTATSWRPWCSRPRPRRSTPCAPERRRASRSSATASSPRSRACPTRRRPRSRSAAAR
jgi:penicillin-binding protein 1A